MKISASAQEMAQSKPSAPASPQSHSRLSQTEVLLLSILMYDISRVTVLTPESLFLWSGLFSTPHSSLSMGGTTQETLKTLNGCYGLIFISCHCFKIEAYSCTVLYCVSNNIQSFHIVICQIYVCVSSARIPERKGLILGFINYLSIKHSAQHIVEARLKRMD